jgi:hypothetical protein
MCHPFITRLHCVGVFTPCNGFFGGFVLLGGSFLGRFWYTLIGRYWIILHDRVQEHLRQTVLGKYKAVIAPVDAARKITEFLG